MHIALSHARARAIFSRLFTAGIEAVNPRTALLRHLHLEKGILTVGSVRYSLKNYRRIVAVGAGKAAAHMAQGLEQVLGRYLSDGLLVVKYGYGAPTTTIRVLEAGHPLPDQNGLLAARRLLDTVSSLTRHDLLIVLLSGGASSLLPSPAPGLTLKDKQHTTELLLRSGATIQEMNTVRKHLSTLKGGQLAAATSAPILTLLLSDVIGDDIGTIGSGPTAPDDTTFAQAWDIVHRYGLERDIPRSVRQHLMRGRQRRLPETPSSRSTIFRRVHHHIVGSNDAALAAAAAAAEHYRLHTTILTSTLTGEAREVAKMFGAVGREIARRGRPFPRPCCLLAGGELTVTVSGKGRGGRAQEFALVGALEIQGLDNLWMAGFGTDGSDGPTDAAGAVVDGKTVSRAEQQGTRATDALLQSNAYGFFQKAGGHITTGPTGTNVNDLYALLAL